MPTAPRLTRAARSALAGAEALIGTDAADAPFDSSAEPPAAPEGENVTDAKFQTIWNFGTETSGFDYACLEPLAANEARDIAEKIHKLRDNEQFRVGELLTTIRPKFSHGQWLAWVQYELQISDQTALNYIRYYELARRSPVELVTLMPVAAAYEVARLDEPLQDIVLAFAAHQVKECGKRLNKAGVADFLTEWRWRQGKQAAADQDDPDEADCDSAAETVDTDMDGAGIDDEGDSDEGGSDPFNRKFEQVAARVAAQISDDVKAELREAFQDGPLAFHIFCQALWDLI
jgi:hypothetical protein